jgi:aminomethyltransferase
VRIDAGLIFKGYEYDGAEDPFEAGIGFVVTRNKDDDFVGKAALARRREHPTQTLVGLELEGSDAVASGEVVAGGETVGVVTSGAFSPVLDKSLALARVKIGHAGLGGRLEVAAPDADSAPVAATVVGFPFYDPDKTRPRS